jgi:hypothetical protein
MLPSGRFQIVFIVISANDDLAQGIGQRFAFGIRADRDAQKLVDARQLEVANDDAFSRSALASSAASRCGWRAKMKLAAEGRTSKPRDGRVLRSMQCRGWR